MENKIAEIVGVLAQIIYESKELSDKERELLKKFQDSAPGNVDPETAEKYQKALGRANNFKEAARNTQDQVEQNILKGQAKREKTQNLYRYNNQASEKNPDLKKIRKQNIWKFIRTKQANIGK